MNVLHWGHSDVHPVPYFRAGMFKPYMPEHGITGTYLDLWSLAPRAIDWCDVVHFNRWYFHSVETADAWDYAEGKAARVYDSDDYDLGIPDWHSWRDQIIEQHPTILRMLREADAVTVSTPHLANLYGKYTRKPPIVVRNAVDMSLYQPTEPRTDDRTTALFYGADARLRDYFGRPIDGTWRGGEAHAAVKDLGLQSVWVGSGGKYPKAEGLWFDRIIPYVSNVFTFFTNLANAGADIGLAPLIALDDFDRSKSELHWLEYSAIGIPTVAQKMMSPSPYSVVRDGVDGLLARNERSWREQVGRLAREPALRADLVAAARERLAVEYDPRKRAAEWAQVYRTALSS